MWRSTLSLNCLPPSKCIGWGTPISWPPRSPDITPYYIFLSLRNVSLKFASLQPSQRNICSCSKYIPVDWTTSELRVRPMSSYRRTSRRSNTINPKIIGPLYCSILPYSTDISIWNSGNSLLQRISAEASCCVINEIVLHFLPQNIIIVLYRESEKLQNIMSLWGLYKIVLVSLG